MRQFTFTLSYQYEGQTSIQYITVDAVDGREAWARIDVMFPNTVHDIHLLEST